MKKSPENNNVSDANNKDRRKLLDSRLKILGLDNSVLKIGDDFVPKSFLPTGIVEIDNVLGDGGGIADGSLVEMCGESQSGKTHIALSAIAEAHKINRRCAFINVENAFYEPRAEALGVQVRNENLFELYENIETAEQYGQLIEFLVKTSEYSIIVIDSITALIPEVDYNKDYKDNPKFGAHATFIGRLAKKLLGLCNKHNTTVIMINQFRIGAGVMPNTYTKQPGGGKAIGYWSHMRLWVNAIGGKEGAVIGDNGEIIGGKSKLVVQKNRFGLPKLECVFPIFFVDAKVDLLGEFLYRASARGKEYIVIKRKVYQYIDKETGEIYCGSKNPVEFVKMLLESPASQQRTKNDDLRNGFYYICGRLKMNETQQQQVLDSLEIVEHNIKTPNDNMMIKFNENVIEDDNFEEEEEDD